MFKKRVCHKVYTWIFKKLLSIIFKGSFSDQMNNYSVDRLSFSLILFREDLLHCNFFPEDLRLAGHKVNFLEKVYIVYIRNNRSHNTVHNMKPHVVNSRGN